ncbi:hypothetical protein ABW21_db0203494 [Orbilia brochopaga]|nr:hypothetical protein ABW21_db0203494 [Drechslerella brochopaga]
MRNTELLIRPIPYAGTIALPDFQLDILHGPPEIEHFIKSEPTIDDFETEFYIKSEPASPTTHIDATAHRVDRFGPAIEAEVGIPEFEDSKINWFLEQEELPLPLESLLCGSLIEATPPPSTPLPHSLPPSPSSELPLSLPSPPPPSLPPSTPSPSPPSSPPLHSSPPPSPINVKAISRLKITRDRGVRFASPHLGCVPPSNPYGNRKNPGRRKNETWPCEIAPCAQRFSNKRQYEQHLSKTHKCKSAICPDCGKSLGRKDYMRDHVKSRRHLHALEDRKRLATAPT